MLNDSFIEDVAVKAAMPLTKSLQEMALTSGWPQEVSAAISVVVKNGDLDIKVEEKFQDTVDRLEYGTYDHVPNPVIRKFKAALPALLEPFISEVFTSKSGELVDAL